MDTVQAVTPTTLVASMLRRWVWIGLFALAAAAGMFLWAKLQTPSYRADMLLVYVAPPEEAEGGGGTGIASGVMSLLGGPADSSGKPVALATLRSRELLAGFIERHRLAPLLYPDIWDPETNRWTVPVRERPTPAEAAETFRSKHLALQEDAADGTITLRLDLPDRRRVGTIANDLVAAADARLRLEAQAESRKNLQFLRTQFAAASNAELRASITKLMEMELHRLALTQTGTRYTFHVIDRAITPRAQNWPRPALFSAVALVLALIAACSASAIFDIWRRERQT